MNNKKVLVTGGGGYIGSVLSEMLLKAGYHVVIYDLFFFGRKAIADIKNHPRLKIVRGDIRDTKKLESILEPGMHIVHLASLSNDPSCDLDPEWSIDINHEATVRLAIAARKTGCRRFILASSCSVYGHGNVELLRETSPCNPVSLYATLKLKSENELMGLLDDDFCPVSLRQATIFGLSPRMRFDLAINQMTLHALTRGKIFVLGGGMQWRPFMHVRDAASAFKHVMEAQIDKVRGQVFNLGSTENNFRILDLAKYVSKVIGGVQIEITPEDADRRDYNVDFTKIKKHLGFKPQVDISTGIKEIVDFINKRPKKDYNTGEFFNIKQLKEYAKKPAVKGGEPVRKLPLTFPLPAITSRAKSVATEGKTSSLNCFDFVKAGEGFDLLLKACGISAGDEVLLGKVCDSWVFNSLKRYGVKIVASDMADDSLAQTPRSIKASKKNGVPVMFLSEFDDPETYGKSPSTLKIAVTSTPPADRKLKHVDVVFWKSSLCPGIFDAPSARVIFNGARLTKKLRVLLKKHSEDRLESPLAGPVIKDAFDRLSQAYLRLDESIQKIRHAFPELEIVPRPAGMPSRFFGIVFKNPRDARQFRKHALAENIESFPLPPGWMAIKDNENGSRNIISQRTAFLPVAPGMSERDVSDIIRLLEKLT